MEKFNNNSSSRIWTGLVILAIGLVYFLRNIGLAIPSWIISWPMLFVVIGLLVGYKRNFNGIGWLIMVLVGGFLTLDSAMDHDFSKYYVAVGFMILGIWLIFKPKGTYKKRWKERCDKNKTADFSNLNTFEEAGSGYVNTDKEDNDILDSVNVFGGSHQNVYSKNFKGGDVIAIFGGCDINLTQADFEDTITLDVVALFGGVKIIVPSGWQIKSEVTAIFGGMDDKRGVGTTNEDAAAKILIIKGVALFGGVDIRNF
ncbi:putative membrane protein [Pedobacter sp. UYP24]